MAEFEYVVPVLVVGGGACGCVAALAAREAGADVLLIERDARPAGSTAMSQGLICAAGTKAQAQHGIDDNADTFLADILAKTRGQTDPVVARMIAEGSGPCLDWLVERWQLPWTLDTGFKPSYGNSRARVHGWAGRNGEDMVQLLHQRLAEQGIDVLTGARLTELVADEDSVVRGVVFTRPDGSEERVGCKAVILASGGFAANEEMVAQYMPDIAAAHYHGHESNVGDGIRLGEKLGGALADMGSYQGYAMLTDPQGITVPPGIIIKGGILVNCDGARFVDESFDIGGMVHQIMEQPQRTGWVIFDKRIEEATAYISESKALMELRAAKVADSVAELANVINVECATLLDAFRQIGDARAACCPDRFGRNWSGDTALLPPYRALKVRGALYHTQGGLQTDGEARVLRANGSCLPNLFAGGGAARGVSGPSSWGYLPAMGLCAAVTTGRVAGQAAARLALSASGSSLSKSR